MRHIALISVVFVVLLASACQRKDNPPKPTVSMLPVVQQAA